MEYVVLFLIKEYAVLDSVVMCLTDMSNGTWEILSTIIDEVRIQSSLLSLRWECENYFHLFDNLVQDLPAISCVWAPRNANMAAHELSQWAAICGLFCCTLKAKGMYFEVTLLLFRQLLYSFHQKRQLLYSCHALSVAAFVLMKLPSSKNIYIYIYHYLKIEFFRFT